MNCPYCQQENPNNANFCHNCGHLLAANCPRCQTLIIPSSHYCYHCGLPVSPQGQVGWWQSTAPNQLIEQTPALAKPKFPVAQQPSPSSAIDRFLPRDLADKLEVARETGSMVGERRVLTMLFCDVKGSTAAAEQLDPEEWTDIINGAFEHMIKPVYKYEGTVARLMGDAILAFFGAPIAHEDDPQRAVLAGLEIIAGIKAYQEQIFAQYELDISARVGINTGLVVVGAVGSDLRMEYTAMGDAINLAARMEQTAEPGTVQIAEPTFLQVNHLFDLEELGPVQVKGKADPLPVFRVLGQKSAIENLRGIEGMRSPLIGRDHELQSLEDILSRTQQGLGHIIFLKGEAGLGKSRLIDEAHTYWLSSEFSGDWQMVSSFSYETNHAFGLFQRLIRKLNNIGVADSPQTVGEKLESLWSTFPAERQPRVKQIFETVFGLESESDQPSLTGESFRQELFSVMLHIWSHLFAHKPTVLVFDDLHWSDPASIQLLTYLFTAVDSNPLILICAFRPDPDAPIAELQRAARDQFPHRLTQIELATLSDTHINSILDELLATADLPDQLRQDILDRASGNPLFVEEVIRSLVLSGHIIAEDLFIEGELQQRWRAVDEAATITIPNNLQGLLAARIDRLEDSLKATLQMASVIGRSFYERILVEMSPNSNGTHAQDNHHLRKLLQLQMIQEAARIPEVEYIFRNPLTQEVAYNSILIKHRREFHEQVGLAMETLFSEQLTEMAPRLAFHFQEARMPNKAFHYYVMAGEKALQFFAPKEALALYDRSIALIDDAQPSSEKIIQLYLERGRALEHGGRYVEAVENYQKLGEIGLEQENKEMQLQALIARGTNLSTPTPLYDSQIAQQLAEDGLTLARDLGNKAAEAKIHWNLMQLSRIRGQEGDAKIAIEHGERSLELARELNLRSQMALTLNNLAALYRFHFQIEKANESSEEARELLRELGNLPMLADSYSQTAHIISLTGALDEAQETAREAHRISTEIGNLWNQGVSGFVLSLIELERGHLAAAQSFLLPALNLPGISQIDFIFTILNLRMAELFLEAGDLDKAQAYAEKTQLSAAKAPLMTGMANAVQNRIQLLKEPDQAQKIILDMSEPAKPDSGLRAYYMVFELQYQMELALAQEKTTAAVQKAEDAIVHLERYDMGIYLPVFRLLLARGLWRQGDQSAARETLALAERKAREIGSRRSLWPILAQQAAWEIDENAAREQRVEAKTLINYVVENAGTAELKQSFLNRPDVKKLLA